MWNDPKIAIGNNERNKIKCKQMIIFFLNAWIIMNNHSYTHIHPPTNERILDLIVENATIICDHCVIGFIHFYEQFVLVCTIKWRNNCPTTNVKLIIIFVCGLRWGVNQIKNQKQMIYPLLFLLTSSKNSINSKKF